MSCFFGLYYDWLFKESEKIDFLSFNGYNVICKVVYVYDGDSIHIVLPLKESKKLVKLKTRLYGIDTPELRNKEQKEKAIMAKNRLIELLEETNNIVKVCCGEFDKYGRVLITLYSPKYEISLNDILVNEKHAVRYFGGTKF